MVQTAGLVSGSVFPVGTTTNTFLVTDGAGLTATCSFDVTVTDTEAPTIACPGPIVVPADPGMCSASGVALGAPVTSDNCGVASVGNNAPLNFPQGVTIVTWTVLDGAGLSATCTQSVTVLADAPSITLDPVSQTLCLGATTILTVSATGTAPLDYQWLHNAAPVGTNSPSLTVGPATPATGGTYVCVVTNPCGSATSNAAIVTVEDPPAVIAPPVSQTACEGTSATFMVTASGNNLTYQWRKNAVPIGGATASTYTINPVQSGDAGSYDVVVTNPCGSVVSAAAVLTVISGETPCTAGVISINGNYAGDTTCLTPQGVLLPLGGCGTNNWTSNDQWWVFTPMCEGQSVASLCPLGSSGSAAFDSHLSVWAGPPQSALVCPWGPGSGTFTEVACNDDVPGCGGGAAITFPVTWSQSYYIRVAGTDAANFGAYSLSFQFSSSLTLSITQPGGLGTILVTNSGGKPGDFYFSAFSIDTANLPPGLGTGWWFGLIIDMYTWIVEATWPGGAPFWGFLDATGSSSWNPGPIGALGNQHVFGVTTTFDPVTLHLHCFSLPVDSGPLQ